MAATLAVLGLVPGAASALCAGWQPTAEARRACCAAGLCADDHAESQTAYGERVITQIDADNCCAKSESEQHGFAASVVAVATLTPPGGSSVLLSSPPLVTHHLVRWLAPPQTDHVPKHVLLSVFLV